MSEEQLSEARFPELVFKQCNILITVITVSLLLKVETEDNELYM
jgi:hypothetical protein